MSGSAPLVAGVDGCPYGWVAVIGPAVAGTPWLTIAPDFKTLVGMHTRVARWAVDIPIGLSCDGVRDCDTMARKRLGAKRGSSVFPAPPRLVSEYSVTDGAQYAEACRLAEQATGKKISRQAWNITPKIAEIRRYLIDNPRSRDRVLECHPELAFARLDGDEPLAAGKKTPEGSLRRRELLNWHFGEDCVNRLVTQTESTRRVGVDDTLDAMACWTVAARAAAGRHESLPPTRPRDPDGLPIAICW